VSVGDYAVFGGNAVVRQHLRVGESAMVAGVSGVRADIIPFACAQGPLANLVGLNVVGLRRRGVAREDIRRLRRAYQALVFGAATSRECMGHFAGDFAESPWGARVIAFPRAGGPRPRSRAARHGDGDAAVGEP